MNDSKLMHYGISNDKDLRAVNAALKTFVERVRDGDEVPQHLLEFIAGGVDRHLRGTRAWSSKKNTVIKNAPRDGLMLALDEKNVRHMDIASHLNLSESRVSDIFSNILPSENLKFKVIKDSEYKYHTELHKQMWLGVFKERSHSEMLCELDYYRKSEN